MIYPERPLFRLLTRTSLVGQIIIGLITGLLLASFFPAVALKVSFIDKVFVSALKAVAPILVFVLVVASIVNHRQGQQTHTRPIPLLYLVGTFGTAMVTVVANFAFSSNLVLASHPDEVSPPGGIAEVLQSLLLSVVDDLINTLISANFVGILAWAIGLGIAFRHASNTTRNPPSELSSGVPLIVRVVIRFAPLGIFGLVASAFAGSSVEALEGYAHLLVVLLGYMLFVAFVVSPLIVFLKIRRNPYLLVLTCLRESGMAAFFTCSSIVNIPVDLQPCERLGLHEDTYSVSIPLGATINVAGAAIIITVLTLAAVYALSIAVDVPTAILLNVVTSVCAYDTSGVAGDSLLLVLLACSLFGIPSKMTVQVAAVGFIIAILQDSAETALNSSIGMLSTAAAYLAEERKASAAWLDPWTMEETTLGRFLRLAPACFDLYAAL